MKQFYLNLTCLLLLPLLLQAQANFKKGFVVNTQGDTLRGFIDYQELGGREPQVLTFKTQETGSDLQEFSPATSRYVEITGLVAYQSFRGRISMDATSLNHLPTHIDTTTQAAGIYLKVVLPGENASLFSFTDHLKTRFFLQIKTRQIRELAYRTFYFTREGSFVRQIQTSKIYIGQLRQAALELQVSTPMLEKKLNQTQYSARYLVPIIHQLNQTASAQQPRAQKNRRYFAGLGFGQATFAVHGSHYLALNTTSKASYFPKISLGLDAFQNPHTQQLFYRVEMILHLAAGDIGAHEQDQFHEWRYRQSFRQTTLSLVPQIGYNVYNRENRKLNLGIGAALNLSAFTDNVYHIRHINHRTTSLSSEENVKDHLEFTSFWYSIPIRAGLILNQKTDISIQYFIPSPITRYATFSISQSSIHLGINYLFNKKQG
jgi:hypothetical protein